MFLYSLSLTLPPAECLQKAAPRVLQPWYADNAAMAGAVSEVAVTMTVLQDYGLAWGYYPEPAKSYVICVLLDGPPLVGLALVEQKQLKAFCSH